MFSRKERQFQRKSARIARKVAPKNAAITELQERNPKPTNLVSTDVVSTTFTTLPQLYNSYLPHKSMPSQKKSSIPNGDTRTPQQKAADTRKANRMKAQELQDCGE